MRKSSFYTIYYALLIVLCASDGWFWIIVMQDYRQSRPQPTISFDNIHEEFETYEADMKIESNLLADCCDNCPSMGGSSYALWYKPNPTAIQKAVALKKCSACVQLFSERSEKCDKFFDCKKRSGEQFCSRCSKDTFSCDGQVCIPKGWKCDQIVDCPNGVDESNCHYKNCTENEFRCGNDRCIDQSLYCNGIDDCGDRSDEKSCPNKTDSNNFDCRPSFIPSKWHCDGVVDCNNGLDEKNCPATANCTENQFKCDNYQCLYVDSVCDGVADCWDRSDEKNCNQTKCAYNQFDCGDVCIPLQWRCDKRKDCLDLSDEKDCNKVNNMYKSYRVSGFNLRCVDGTFPCADQSGCISNDFVCDKYPNCKDHSDEKNCPNRKDLV